MYLSDSTLHSAIDGISRTLGIYVEVEGAEYAPASIIRLEWENECIEGSNFNLHTWFDLIAHANTAVMVNF